MATDCGVPGRRFLCREWAWAKLWACLEQRPAAKTCGALLVGGPGTGKTALCTELVTPTASHGRHASALQARLLAHHFCHAHNAASLSVGCFVQSLVEQLAESPLLAGYDAKVQAADVRSALEPCALHANPDEALKRAVLFPLLELDPPDRTLLLVVDSIDETDLQPPSTAAPRDANLADANNSGPSRSIAELLATHHHLLPQWLLLVVTARRTSRSVIRQFAGFRKVALDDLRRGHVVRDVQQYILCRLDREPALRHHLSRETAEMLNQLHIKSNGCFLYLERVLDGVAEGWDWAKRWSLLRRVLAPDHELRVLLFHHSFAEWLLDVKHCTQKYLVDVADGHAMLAMCLSVEAPSLDVTQVHQLALHLSRIHVKPPLEHFHLPLWMEGPPTEVRYEELEQEEEEEEEGEVEAEVEVAAHENQDEGEAERDSQEQEGKAKEEEEEEQQEEVRQDTLEELACEVDLLQMKEQSMEEEEKEKDQVEEERLRQLEAENRDYEEEKDEEYVTMVPLPGHFVGEGTTGGRSTEGVDSGGRSLLHSAAHQGDASLVRLLLERGACLGLQDRAGQTPLNLAARHGHAEVVATLLGAGADPDHADADGWTALRSAAWGGHTGVVTALLAGGTQVDLADGDGRTALRAAAWGGHEDVVAALLRHGAAVNRADSEGRTPLIAAAYMGHSEIVEMLLDAGADVNHQDVDGRTALSVAALCVPASEGHGSVVMTLLERDAVVDHQDHDGLTPLLVAAFEGHTEVCELLLEYEADVDHVDRSGRTPLLAAASMGHAAVVERLLFWGCYVDHIDAEGRTVLSVAAAQGSQETVRLLLDRGLDETHRDNAGWTPLHYAAFEGHCEVCEALVEAGARVNEVDNDGKHALVLAAQEGHAAVVASLLDAGANIHHTSHDGRSALRVAALEGHKDVVHLLLCREADLHYKDADGRSTLYLLALENRLDMARFLMESNADVESTDLEGRTPLHVTAWQGHADMVALLLQGGARVDAVDKENRTPLQSAAWQGHAEVVRLLLEHGANVDHTCSQGATALSIAAQEGHEASVAVLLQYGANPAHSDRCGRTAIKVALKGGHIHVARMLEESLIQQQQAGGVGRGLAAPSSVGSGSTAETKPCSALLCPGLTASPAESPESTFEKRRSVASLGQHSSSKSSGNLTTSTHSSGGPRAPTPREAHLQQHQQPLAPPAPSAPPASAMSPVLSFTQQLQQCGRGRGRRHPPPPQPALTPLDEPASPLYASPPLSPLSDGPGGGRHLPAGAILEDDYTVPLQHSAVRPPRPSAPPSASRQRGEGVRSQVFLVGKRVSEGFSLLLVSLCTLRAFPGCRAQLDLPAVIGRRGGGVLSGGGGGGGVVPGLGGIPGMGVSVPGVGGAGSPGSSGFTFTQDQHMRIILGTRSPEPRPRRNGIVTNPSLKAAHAKAAHLLRNGLSGRPRQPPARPNGLPLKKETPL
ncbi:putative ankyrin repeat domain-containing protein 50 isoform X2 [Penaeus vannamei]|uniref:Putative ankyrin repeat domain-containing protein 50 isoform X2 n=1 Tax=Penaeus vannamei TaxID=6689 RepID=A0A3R7SX21_PENVA|nr:putative ankyrin repeat domain-containing protein 50 isoform X2 [Penaeus vannamei]